MGLSQGAGSIGGQVKANGSPAAADGLLSIATVLYNPTTQTLELDAAPITRLIGGSGDDGLEAVAVVPSGTAAGRILVGGHQTVSTSGDLQAYLAAYDGSGTRLWEQWLGQATSAERITAVVCDASQVYVAGSTRGVLAGSASQRAASRTDADAFLAAFDLTGKQLWAAQLDDSLLQETSVQLALSGSRLELLTGDGADLRRVSFSTGGQRLSSELIGGASRGVEIPGRSPRMPSGGWRSVVPPPEPGRIGALVVPLMRCCGSAPTSLMCRPWTLRACHRPQHSRWIPARGSGSPLAATPCSPAVW